MNVLWLVVSGSSWKSCSSHRRRWRDSKFSPLVHSAYTARREASPPNKEQHWTLILDNRRLNLESIHEFVKKADEKLVTLNAEWKSASKSFSELDTEKALMMRDIHYEAKYTRCWSFFTVAVESIGKWVRLWYASEMFFLLSLLISNRRWQMKIDWLSTSSISLIQFMSHRWMFISTYSTHKDRLAVWKANNQCWYTTQMRVIGQ